MERLRVGTAFDALAIRLQLQVTRSNLSVFLDRNLDPNSRYLQALFEILITTTKRKLRFRSVFGFLGLVHPVQQCHFSSHAFSSAAGEGNIITFGRTCINQITQWFLLESNSKPSIRKADTFTSFFVISL
ncbi:hypothetical protein AVEN_104335-1 [Araneus ventricosus]|uniref:Uncharacterized protein n=1 Tax=Araneus ventricosus TaxID=182803 RepID=A0A4Y2BV73_ARAVE|nr:hypothetical protein AVEN_104335-1 [Araneus ventricosus]